jgi:hypothetical protein
MPSVTRRRAPSPDLPVAIVEAIASGGKAFTDRMEAYRAIQRDADEAQERLRVAEAGLSAERSGLIEAKAAYQRDADEREAALAEREAVVVQAEMDARLAALAEREGATADAVIAAMLKGLEVMRRG